MTVQVCGWGAVGDEEEWVIRKEGLVIDVIGH
jgi:hypothetical protein